MARISLEISYDGANFLGWQSQPHGRGVQDAVESALRSVCEPSRITGAGRTDAGVHARRQVAHFDAVRDWEPRRLALALNAHLPAGVSVMRADVETDDFHARRSALWREYRYFIHNAPTCYPHIKPYVLWLKGMHYDWRLASRASRVLIGKHDFGAFCRTADRPDDAVRTVRSVSLHSRGGLVVFRIIANSYLTNMVRIAVGNLLSVASGRRDENWLRSLLEVGRDRNDSSITVPPGGLFLWNVIYK